MPRFAATFLRFTLSALLSLSISAHETEANAADKPVLARVGNLVFEECLVTANGRERKVQCAHQRVLENPKDPQSEKINLFIVRIPARRPPPTPLSPLLFIAGGPGQAASESFLFADQIYSALAKSHDFYLIDQRGTGQSHPLICQDAQAEADYLTEEYDDLKIRQAEQRCLQQMTGDVAYYTTDNTISDFEVVREALQISQWNLLGVSYGTRVATQYIRRHPNKVRTAVLDSVVPPDHVLGLEIEQRSQESLDKLIERCEEDNACHEAMPHLRQEIKSLFVRLHAQPIEIRYEDFTTGELQHMTFSIGHLRLLIRLYLYNSHSAALLPPMLHNAEAQNNFSALARAVKNLLQSSLKNLAPGLHNSIMCSEEVPFFPQQTSTPQSEISSYLGGHFIDSMRSICSVWPVDEPPEDLKAPFVSDIPTLLISGEFDPITPPSYAVHTQQFFSNSQHFMLRGQAHSTSSVGCMPYLIEKFVSAGSSKNLNADCLSRVSPIPLFINMNGTAP